MLLQSQQGATCVHKSLFLVSFHPLISDFVFPLLPIPSPPPCLPIPSSPSPSLLLARRRGRYLTLRGTMRRSSASKKVLSLISLTPSMRTGWRACWDRPEESSPAAMYRSACVSECECECVCVCVCVCVCECVCV